MYMYVTVQYWTIVRTFYCCCLTDLLQLREHKRERKISNDKVEEESEEIRKIKKVDSWGSDVIAYAIASMK